VTKPPFISVARVWPGESFPTPAAKATALELASKRLMQINPPEARRIKRLAGGEK